MIFFIAYELDTWSRDLNSDFTLQHCLFGGVKLAKNADPNKCVYSGYGNGFDLCSIFFTLFTFFLFLELIWAHQCILIIRIRKKIS